MALYYFHLRDDVDELLDPDGTDLPDIEAVRAAAVSAARDTLSHDLREGYLDLRYRIDVEDSHGSVVCSLPLADTFEVITRSGRGLASKLRDPSTGGD